MLQKALPLLRDIDYGKKYCNLQFLYIFTLSIIRYGESFRDKGI